MQMKVFSKGQVVIPAEIRRFLGIKPGDHVEIELDRERMAIEVYKPEQYEAQALAGSLSKYAADKTFPTKKEMDDALRKGLRHG